MLDSPSFVVMVRVMTSRNPLLTFDSLTTEDEDIHKSSGIFFWTVHVKKTSEDEDINGKKNYQNLPSMPKIVLSAPLTYKNCLHNNEEIVGLYHFLVTSISIWILTSK